MTLIAILGDLHTRKSPPIERVDDYNAEHYRKLRQSFAHFKKLKVKGVIAPGDIFNNYGRDSYEVLYALIDFLKTFGLPLFVVKGQHDIRFHNLDVTDTPLQILLKSGLAWLLNDKPTFIEDVALFGASFGEPLFNVPKEHGKVNILVMHKMIINGKKLWPGQTDYSQARILERKYNYDLFVCGDNHNAFVNGKVINYGSLMRMNINQADHHPMYGVYNIKKKQLKTFKYNIEPANKVLGNYDTILGNLKRMSKKQKQDFVESLGTDFEGNTNYKQNVHSIMKEKRRVRKRTRKIIEEALQ